jgi:hypothetical protein
MVGGEANDPQLLSMMQAASSIPVEVAKPLLSADTSKLRPADRHGSMSEWATAFGLAMRTTKRTFGPIDGKPREVIAGKPAAGAPSMVEVVDLHNAVHAAAKLPDAPTRRASDRAPALVAAGEGAARA